MAEDFPLNEGIGGSGLGSDLQGWNWSGILAQTVDMYGGIGGQMMAQGGVTGMPDSSGSSGSVIPGADGGSATPPPDFPRGSTPQQWPIPSTKTPHGSSAANPLSIAVSHILAVTVATESAAIHAMMISSPTHYTKASTAPPPWAGTLHPSHPGWRSPYYPGDKSVDPFPDPYEDQPDFSLNDWFTHNEANPLGYKPGFSLYFGGNSSLALGGLGAASGYFNLFNPMGTEVFGGFSGGNGIEGDMANPFGLHSKADRMSLFPPEYYSY